MPDIKLPIPEVTPGSEYAYMLNDAITAINDEQDTGRLSEAGVNEAIVSVSELLEIQPMWVTGHSWQASTTSTTSGGRWYERVMKRMFMGTATNRAQSGRTIGDIAMATLGGANAWVPRTKALVGVACTINDVTLFDGSIAARVGYTWAWRALLAQLTANAAIAANTSSFVYSSSSAWTRQSVVASTGQASGVASTGGAWWTTSTIGSYFEFTFTGTAVDVFLIARGSTGAGLVTFTEGATALGSVDLSAPTAQDTPATFRIKGLSAGTHTIRGTLTAGASLTVDSYRIPSTAPAPIVVLGEPPVIPGVDDIPNYVAEVEYLKGLLANICADFPSVTYVDLTRLGWDQATMLVADGKHPNDHGAAWIATQVLSALSTVPYSGGLGTTLDQNYPAAYVAPAGPAVPPGGVVGDYTPPITPNLPTDYVSRYTGASTAPTADGATFTPWVDSGTALVNFTATNAPTVRTSPFRNLEFDGVNDVMTRTPNAIPDSTTFIVGKIRSLVGGSAQILLATVGGTHTIGKQSTGTWILNDGSVLDSGVTAVQDQWVVIGCVSGGASSLITIDGAPAMAGNAGSASGSFTQYRLGESTGTTFYPVNIAEVVIYQYAMTETQLRAAALQLKANYGL